MFFIIINIIDFKGLMGIFNFLKSYMIGMRELWLSDVGCYMSDVGEYRFIDRFCVLLIVVILFSEG